MKAVSNAIAISSPAHESESGAEQAVEKRESDGAQEAAHDPSEHAAAEQHGEHDQQKSDQIRDARRTRHKAMRNDPASP